MNEPEGELHGVLDRYRRAVFEKDVDALVDLYDTDVRIFDAWSVWSHRGQAAWRGVAVDWLGTLGAERVVVEFSDVESALATDLVVVHAFVRYRAIDPGGATLRALDNRMTMVLRRSGEAWKIVHEHTSAPIDGESGKALLTR